MAKLFFHLVKYSKGRLPVVESHLRGQKGDYVLWELPRENLKKSVFSRVGQRENPERAVRRDAVLLCEAQVSAEQEFFEGMEPGDVRKFFQGLTEFFLRRYEEENCMYAAVHVEDGPPHLHYGFVPMTGEGRLSAKALIHRDELRSVQAELPQYVRQQGFPVEQSVSFSGTPTPVEESSPDAPGPVEKALEPAWEFDFAKPASREEVTHLQRENQRLQLENILLDRQLRSLMMLINSDPQLEAMFLRQLEKKETPQIRTARLG